MFLEEVEFERDDAVVIPLFVFDDFFEDVGVDVSVTRGIESLIGRKILRPYNINPGGDIDFNLIISSKISSGSDFFFGESIIDEIGCGIVEVEGIH